MIFKPVLEIEPDKGPAQFEPAFQPEKSFFFPRNSSSVPSLSSSISILLKPQMQNCRKHSKSGAFIAH